MITGDGFASTVSRNLGMLGFTVLRDFVSDPRINRLGKSIWPLCCERVAIALLSRKRENEQAEGE
tara:strand:- start:317 stop:511 length:195 start_codon:yes stop_codon:yes gene_type:complete